MAEQFNWKLFDDEGEYEETPLRDRKSRFPDLHRRAHPEDKAELLRDVIALANTARLFGKPAYLLFGLRNDISDRENTFVGINESLTIYQDAEDQSLQQIREKVRVEIGSLLAEYIEPPLAGFEIKIAERSGQQAAYLMVEPVPAPHLFHVSRNFDKGIKSPLRVGDCYIRIGESKRSIVREPISPKDARYVYSYAQVPYVLPNHWRTYLQKLASERTLAYAESVEAYQPLSTASNSVFDAVVEKFLTTDDQLLVVIGPAGCGKTTALYRKVIELARNCAEEVDSIIASEEFRTPSRWIPIVTTLKEFDEKDMDRQVLSIINYYGSFWTTRPDRPEQLLEKRGIHWLLCLDGFDEIFTDQRQQAILNSLKTFLYQYPTIKTILTTRPDAALPDFEQWPKTGTVKIAGFSEEQISQYVSNFVRTNMEYEEYLRYLNTDKELWSLCAYPLYLSAIMGELVERGPNNMRANLSEIEEDGAKYVDEQSNPLVDSSGVDIERVLSIAIPEELLMLPEDLPIQRVEQNEPDNRQEHELPISLGRLLDRVYNRLWDREMSRHHFGQEADDWWIGAAKLAADTDGHRLKFRRDEARQILSDDRALKRLLSLGILDAIREQRGMLCFRTALTKAYFAAVRLRLFVDSNETDGALAAYQQMTIWFRDITMRILGDLTVADLSIIAVKGEPDESYPTK